MFQSRFAQLRQPGADRYWKETLLQNLNVTGWWCNNPLETYDSQWEGLSPIYEGFNPPARMRLVASFLWRQKNK